MSSNEAKILHEYAFVLDVKWLVERLQIAFFDLFRRNDIIDSVEYPVSYNETGWIMPKPNAPPSDCFKNWYLIVCRFDSFFSKWNLIHFMVGIFCLHSYSKCNINIHWIYWPAHLFAFHFPWTAANVHLNQQKKIWFQKTLRIK